MTANATLQFNGPSGNALGAPALVFIEAKTFSAQPNVMFNAGFSSDFDEYVFKIINVSQSTGGGHLLAMRVSTNGGVSVDTGTNYKDVGISSWVEGVVQLSPHNSNTCWPVCVDMNDSTPYGVSGTVSIITPGVISGNNVHSSYNSKTRRTDSGLTTCLVEYDGWYVGAPGARINAVEFLDSGSSCTFTGKIILYGVRNSN